MSEVKDRIFETNDEEPLVTDNSVINVPRYFKLFECGRNSLKTLDAAYDQVCMEIS